MILEIVKGSATPSRLLNEQCSQIPLRGVIGDFSTDTDGPIPTDKVLQRSIKHHFENKTEKSPITNPWFHFPSKINGKNDQFSISLYKVLEPVKMNVAG
jgi:hypothetical protein